MSSQSVSLRRLCIFLVIMLQSCLYSARADNPRYDYTPLLKGPVRVLPPTVIRNLDGKRGLGLTNTSFKDGEIWQALVCVDRCSLVSVTLAVHTEVLLQYFNDTVTGQRLTVAKSAPGKLIGLFHGLSPNSHEKPLITLLHRGMRSYPSSGRPGSLEIGIPQYGSERLRIVPRLVKGTETLRIYLESDSRRQRLGEVSVPQMNAGVTDIATGRNLLLWAGELDGDGKPDFVMGFENWVGNDTSVVLFLSSYAKGSNFVGEAGSFFLASQYD